MLTNPKKLFLIDGFGALLSAFMLGFILTKFQSLFGMPLKELYILSFLPCIFALYDFFCYFKVNKNTSFYIKIIANANLFYCVISIFSVINNFQNLTKLGLVYFLLELIIIIVLVFIELRIANNINKIR